MHHRFLPLLAFCMLAAPSHAQDRFEPNNSFDQAKQVKLNEPFESSINPLKDVDWFTTSITQAGYVRVTIDNEAVPSITPVVQLFSAEDRSRPLAGRSGYSVVEARVEPGPFYFAISDQYRDSADAGMLKVTVQFWAESDATEVNEDFAHARTVKLDDTVDFALMPRGDVDMFTLAVPQTGYLRVIVDNSAAKQVDTDLEIYNSKRQKLDTGKVSSRDLERAGTDGAFEFNRGFEARVSGGQVFVRITSRNGTSPNGLKATFQFTAESDPSEPNHSFTRAREVKPGDTVDVALRPAGDNDMFRLKIAEPGYLGVVVDTSKVRSFNSFFEIYDATQASLGFIRDNFTKLAIPAGDVYVNIRELDNSSYDAELPVTFFFFPTETDATEPNDSVALAREVQPGDTVDFTLSSLDDHDMFRLKIAEPGYLRVIVENPETLQRDTSGNPLPVLAEVMIYDATQASLGAHIHLTYRKTRWWGNRLTRFEQSTGVLLQEEFKERFREKFRLSTEARVAAGDVYVNISGGFLNKLTATFSFFPAESDVTEPNDSVALAREVKPGDTVDFAIMPLGDRDVFRLSLDKPGDLQLEVDQSEAEGLDLVYSIYNERGQRIGGSLPEPFVGLIKDERNTTDLQESAFVRAGTVYVSVEDQYHQNSSLEMLKATFTFTPAEDDDPRVTIADDAVAAKFGAASAISVNKEQSRLVYRLESPSAGMLLGTLKWATPNPPVVSLHLYGEHLQYLGNTASGGGAVPKGTIYVVASVNPDRLGGLSNGTVTFTHTPGNDPHEPNNHFASARKVTLNETVTLTLFPKGDRDFFRCQIEKPGYLGVLIAKEESSLRRLRSAIYDSSHRQIGSSSTHVKPGEVFVQILDADEDGPLPGLAGEGPGEPIKVTFQFITDTDPSEPNNSFRTARTVKLGSTVDFMLMPAGDQDYFSIDCPTAGYLQVAMLRSAGYRIGGIYDHNFRKLATDSYLSLDNRRNFAARVPKGKVYVMAKHSDFGGWSAEQFKAHITLTPDPDKSEPNDRFPLARTITPGDPTEIYLMPHKDEDYYKLEVPGPGFVYVRLDAAGERHQWAEAQIFNQHQEEKGTYQEKKGEIVGRVEAGTVYIKFNNFGSVPENRNSVRATVIFLPDNPVPALIRHPGEIIEMELTSEGSIVTSPVRITEPGFLSAKALFPPTTIKQLTVDLLTPSGQVIVAGDPRLYPPGIYHVIAHVRKGQSKSPLAVRVHSVKSIDIYEPNDTENEAAEITLPFRGWICLHDFPHADHFRFNVKAVGLYQIRIDHPTLNPQAQFSIWPAGQKSTGELRREFELQGVELPLGAARGTPIPNMVHTGVGYTTLYARFDARQYQLALTGNETSDGNANPVKFSIDSLSTGDLPPGDLAIMAFGLSEISFDYRFITNLSRMVTTPLRTGETAEDVAAELQDTVSNTNVPEHGPTEPPDDNSAAVSTAKPDRPPTETTPDLIAPPQAPGETTGSGTWRKLVGAVLLLIAIACAVMIMRKPSSTG